MTIKGLPVMVRAAWGHPQLLPQSPAKLSGELSDLSGSQGTKEQSPCSRLISKQLLLAVRGLLSVLPAPVDPR